MTFALLLGAAVADFAATSLAISRFGITGESNVIAATLYGAAGLWGLAIGKSFAVYLISTISKRYRTGKVAAGFAIGLWTFGALTALRYLV